MKAPDDNSSVTQDPSGDARAGDNELTGLPWLGTWRGVYVLVLGSFILWVGLLFALSVVFS